MMDLIEDFADHTLVYTIRRVVKNRKQAVAFKFCESATKIILLKNLMKQFIMELRAIGNHVISTVCDQESVNRSAVNKLIKETRGIYSNGWKNIVDTMKGTKLTGNWLHIEACYEIDQQEVGDLRLRPNLTDRHMKLYQTEYHSDVLRSAHDTA